MRILVTNDDGITSSGIAKLTQELARIGDVFVVAPDRERSASSHSITFHKPLRVDSFSVPYATHAWKVDGTPADCVKIAFDALLDFTPDVIISGINKGPNLGSDVLYSGTVAAAIEGHINGAAGIAVSHAAYVESDFQPAASVVRDLVEILFAQKIINPSSLVNINVPDALKLSLDDVRITSLGERKYENAYDARIDPRGRKYFWLTGDVISSVLAADEGQLTDIEAISKGLISVTPLQIDLTDYSAIEKMNLCLKTHVHGK
jgi:5'-nucleotidase